jgi:acetyl-CoA acetyltransferase
MNILRDPSVVNRILKEPPFRLLIKQLVKTLPVSIDIKAAWDANPRPPYAVGVLRAAWQATKDGVPEISVIEFGVAEGSGLLALQEIAAAVEKQSNVRILVYGFDTGSGLPETMGDFREHPAGWKAGAYPRATQQPSSDGSAVAPT